MTLFSSQPRNLFTVLRPLLMATLVIFIGMKAAIAAPEQVSLDYAYYNPVSLLLKEKGWLEAELEEDNINVRWTLSQGSNKALEYLRAGAIDFGSTAGSAALVARTNGLPIQSIYQYSKPEWTALVTKKDSGITRVADLKGKTVAVTRGTDPHIFLLRALAQEGLSENDINTALLQHSDGYNALIRGQVDAWAGLDPHMARAELEADAQLFHRDVDLNTYGILNAHEDFLQQHPELVTRILSVYERARQYAQENPGELQQILAKAARISPQVAARQLQRTDISRSAMGEEHRKVFVETGRVLQEIGIIRDDVDVPAVTEQLINPQFNHDN